MHTKLIDNGPHPLSIRNVAMEQELLKSLPASNSHQWSAYVYYEVGSTMDVAAELSAQVSPRASMLIIGLRQTQGRGRQGKVWLAPDDSFSGTYAFAADHIIQNVSSFSLVVGCAVRDVCRSLGADVSLKWPNDIVSLDARKLCGVLTTGASSNNQHHVSVGIGMNLISKPGGVSHSISLSELCGQKLTAVQFAAHLSPVLLQYWQTFLSKGFSHFRDLWLSGALHLERPVSFNTGAETISAVMRGITKEGCLVLLHEGQEKEFSAGHFEDIYKG